MTNQHINRIEGVTSRFIFFSTRQTRYFRIGCMCTQDICVIMRIGRRTIDLISSRQTMMIIALFHMLITSSHCHINMYISWKIQWCNQISICKCYQSIDRWESSLIGWFIHNDDNQLLLDQKWEREREKEFSLARLFIFIVSLFFFRQDIYAVLVNVSK